ncbi:MAG: serine/threonine protein kinase [Deltaproteobacteria bacterium]|nr:serine/threonine protein kinase [Deltaproteobacteria bacterium]
MSDDANRGGAEQLGRYTLVRRIGKGGMGEVWLAKATGAHGFEKPVAIKRILPQFSSNPHIVNMLVDEARICVLLSHPNVVQVLELGEDQGEYFIAMEYVEGQALSRLMRKLRKQGKRLEALEACYIAIQLLEGLHAAHIQKDNRGKPAHIIHRDVSPQNVLLSSNGQIKVIDFGIARARERLEVTQGTNVKGKLRYMAPEQIAPKVVKGAALDHRVDVFAAGIVLFEMLAGRQRFPGDNEIELMDAILKEDTPDLCREGLIDRPLMDILDAALEKDRERRYPDAAAFAAQLRSYLYKRDPGFTAERIAKRLREAFAGGADAEKSEPRREATRPAPDPLTSASETPLHGGGTEDREATRTAFRPKETRGGGGRATPATEGAPVQANDPTRVRRKGRGKGRSLVPLAAGLLLGVAALGGLYLAFRPRVPTVEAGTGPAAMTTPPVATSPTNTAPPPVATVPPVAVTPSPAPPSPPPPDGAGVVVTVVAEPATARISLASQPDPKYVSPALLKLMRGEAVQVVVEADGYETARRALVADQAQQLSVVLAPLPVDLVIHVYPHDAVVTVNGAPAKAGMKVRPGVPVEVRAEHPFAVARVVSETPVPGRPFVVELRLDEVESRRTARMAKGTLVIDSRPIGADIWVDGRKLAGLTPHSEPVIAGSHRVTVRLGNSEQTFTVDVGDGEKAPVTALLE